MFLECTMGFLYCSFVSKLMYQFYILFSKAFDSRLDPKGGPQFVTAFKEKCKLERDKKYCEADRL